MTTRAPSSRNEVAVLDCATSFAARAPIYVRAAGFDERSPIYAAPRACGRSRCAERADAPLELSLLLLLTPPRQLNQGRRVGHASAAEPPAIRRC